MTIPRTPLSQLYHSTIPAYRDEMHLDMEQAYRRFGIPKSATEWRAAVEAVDVAAFKVRDAKKADKLGPKKDLLKTSAALFDALAPLLAAEIATGATTGSQDSMPAADSLLAKLYCLVYSRTYLNSALSAAAQAIPKASSVVKASWDALRTILAAGRGDVNDLTPHTQTLCDALSAEFNDSLWVIIW